jgi:thiamine-monophosphate kinase
MSKELAIIETIAQLLPNREMLGDDVYVDPASGWVFTTDMLVEHRHFSLDTSTPADLGWKACAVNLSDLASVGASPRFLMVGLGLPQALGTEFVREFYEAFQSLATQHGATLIGGDTVGARDLTLGITAIGQMEKGRTAGTRNQAQPGDYILTTGVSGLSAVGLAALQTGEAETYPESVAAHRRPIPLVTEGQQLAGRFARYAMMDTSDGLADALLKVAQQSRVRLVVQQGALAIHPELTHWARATGTDPLQPLLYGGEDFQLLATVPELDDAILSAFQVIGRVEAGPSEAVLVDSAGVVTRTLSFEHTYQHFGATS